MRSALLSILAACGAAPHATAPGKPPPPSIAGFDTCDLVTLDDKAVMTTWRLTPSGAKLLGRTTVGTPMSLELPEDRVYARPMKADWADRDHLFVSPDDHTVLLVTASGIEHVAVPDLAKQLAKPDDGASETGGGKEYTRVDLVVRDGEAWWVKCPWSYPNDGGYCAGWISAELWPKQTVVKKDVAGRDDAWADIKDAACEAHLDDEHELYGTHWLAPDRVLLVWGYHSEFDSPPPDRWELRERCDGKPLASGNDPRPERDGLWLSSEGDARVIRRGDRVLGKVPGDRFTAVAIRPTSRQK